MSHQISFRNVNKAIWENEFYYLFGFLFLVFIILIVACSQISIVMTYFQVREKLTKNWPKTWSNFWPKNCSKEFNITCLICNGNALLNQSLLLRIRTKSGHSNNLTIDQNGKSFGPLLNCSNIHFWPKFEVRLWSPESEPRMHLRCIYDTWY